MEINNSSSIGRLEAAINAAKTRTGSKIDLKSSSEKSSIRKPKTTSVQTVGSLFERLYGNAVENSNKKPDLVGTKFDLYA